MQSRIMSIVVLALCCHVVAAATLPDAARLRKLQAQFATVDIRADVSSLPPSERAVLTKLVAAAKFMDSLYLRQVWAGNESLLLDLERDRSELGRARLDAFLLQKGPWDRQNRFAPLMPSVPAKPEGANFYPADATKADIDRWMAALPVQEQQAAKSFYTTIRRDVRGNFMLVPYSQEYQGELLEVARLLREAAALTTQPTLKAFLEKRAQAFLSNDYYDSEVAWMDLDSSIEPTIGPYENYEDNWFNYKAAFEAFITVRDDAETAKVAKFSSLLQQVEDRLPFDPKYRNKKLGAAAPIRVVNELFAAGDANHDVQTTAFNLPNDERVTKEKGSKRVLLRNVSEAKFNMVLKPVAAVALSPDELKHLDFDAFFTWVLMHELMHGLGPHEISVGGRPTTARHELQELHGAIEEAKADITGLWAMQYFVDRKVLPAAMGKTMYATYLASAFRTIRFGIVEAHGRGQLLQLNYLLDRDAVKLTSDGRFEINPKRIRQAVEQLTGELLTLEARGDYAGSKALLDKFAVVRPSVQRVLDQLQEVPVDIRPRYVGVEK